MGGYQRSRNVGYLLRDHPNFVLPAPQKNETLVNFTLRCAAHLLSPPKIEGEDMEVSCQEAAQEIRALDSLIEKKWKAHHDRD